MDAITKRRRFVSTMVSALLGSAVDPLALARGRHPIAAMPRSPDVRGPRSTTLFLCGDVMTGRGIDQILPSPVKPNLYEAYVRSALRYVEIAEQASGPIARPVEPAYVWGDVLAVLERLRPDARIINLETAITTAEDAWVGKGIHYRMHPANVGCLSAASLDCCVLANNHVLDWGYRGLSETLATLRTAGIRTAGAGLGQDEADTPAIIPLAAQRRAFVFAFGMENAGVPQEWAATKDRAGVSYLADLSPSSASAIGARVAAVKHNGDIAIASIHWGGNWGYDVPPSQRAFAHELIDHAGIDVVHGHSSHHVKGIEIYRERPILYGCGDFLNDYEGIGGYESFRSELGLMYFPTLGATGVLEELRLVPTRIRHLRVNRAHDDDVEWLASMLTRQGRKFGTRAVREADDTLAVRWR